MGVWKLLLRGVRCLLIFLFVGLFKIEVSGLRYEVDGVGILNGVDARLPAGEVLGVVGPSGAGKSTLLRAVNRLIEPTAGEVYLDGVATGTMDPLELRRRVGMVFQLPALFGESVEEAMLYGARLAGKEVSVGRLLRMVGLEEAMAEREPGSLSVGQQQRVSIARALALEPEALLMDEPTSALDEAARNRIEDLVRELNRTLGLAVMFVSHDLAQVKRIASRVVLILDGKSEGEWGVEEFFSGSVGDRAGHFISGGH